MDRLPLHPRPTACEGHTGPDVEVGKVYSPAQCEAWKKQDLAIANAIVHRCVTREMPVGVEAALTDFTINNGAGAAGIKDGLCILKNGRMPRIRIYANAGNWLAVCNEFQYWANAGGKRLPGLVRRAEARRAVCMKSA
jgi:lysozyme